MKVVIFDFDGTIADNFRYVSEAVNSLAPKYHVKPFTTEEIEQLRTLSLREIVKKFDITFFNLFRMTLDGRREMGRYIGETKPPVGLAETLAKLKEKGYSLAVISSNGKSNIEKFLAINQLGVFDHIYSSLALFGKHKIILRFMRKYHFTPSEVTYVGDEVRDIEAAKQAGVRVISVSWGYNARAALAKKNDLIADKPEDLLTLIQ